MLNDKMLSDEVFDDLDTICFQFLAAFSRKKLKFLMKDLSDLLTIIKTSNWGPYHVHLWDCLEMEAMAKTHTHKKEI